MTESVPLTLENLQEHARKRQYSKKILAALDDYLNTPYPKIYNFLKNEEAVRTLGFFVKGDYLIFKNLDILYEWRGERKRNGYYILDNFPENEAFVEFTDALDEPWIVNFSNTPKISKIPKIKSKKSTVKSKLTSDALIILGGSGG